MQKLPKEKRKKTTLLAGCGHAYKDMLDFVKTHKLSSESQIGSVTSNIPLNNVSCLLFKLFYVYF